MLLVGLAIAGACASTTKSGRTSDPDVWASRAEVDGDFDKAEARWRREIGADPAAEPDAHLLTDDPPAVPQETGAVAFAESGEREQVAAADEVGDGFWTRLGKGSFAAFTVLFTVGMAVAPYLLL